MHPQSPSLVGALTRPAPSPYGRGAVTAVACVTAAALAFGLCTVLSRVQVRTRVARATVRIMVPTPSGTDPSASVQGTGVIIAPDGYALTAAHVVRGAATGTVEVIVGSGTRRAQVVSARVTEHVGVLGRPSPREMGGDYALLKLGPAGHYPFVRVATSGQIAAGTPCYVAGFPVAEAATTSAHGPRPRLGRGRITAVMHTDAGAPAALNTDVPVREGMSGGPCTNAAGELLGLAIMYSSQANANVVLPAWSFRQVWEPLLAEGG